MMMRRPLHLPGFALLLAVFGCGFGPQEITGTWRAAGDIPIGTDSTTSLILVVESANEHPSMGSVLMLRGYAELGPNVEALSWPTSEINRSTGWVRISFAPNRGSVLLLGQVLGDRLEGELWGFPCSSCPEWHGVPVLLVRD